MEPQYTWLNVSKDSPKSIIEIMGAPISEPSVFLEEISSMLVSGVTLCIGGEIKTSEEGKPASNFRYEKDLELNSNVIENYIQLFNLHRDIFRSKPIFVTTIPRSWRKYSWLIQEDGMMLRKDQDYVGVDANLLSSPKQQQVQSCSMSVVCETPLHQSGRFPN